jgi:signal transduction histidine kinase
MIAGASSASAETVALQTGDFAHDLAPDIRFLEDKEKSLTISEVVRLDPERDFSPVTTKLVDFGFSRSRYWLRASVRNTMDEKATWKLAVEFPYIEFLRVYLVRSGRPETLLAYGEANEFSERGMSYRYFAPDVTLEAGEQAEIVLAYSSKQATQLPISIESPAHFLDRIHREDLVNWSLLVLLIGMTLVSTVYLVALGFHMAVFYGIYVLLSALYLFHTDGYAFQYLWPDWPTWNSVAVAPIGLAMVASGSLFARAYVDAPRHFPTFNKLLVGSVGIVAALMALSPWLIQNQLYKTGSLLFIIVCAGLYFAAGVFAFRRGQAGAGFFVAASMAIISTILFGIYGYLNPGEFNQDIAGYYGRYALFFEGIAFSLAIYLHIQSMRHNHDEALKREIQVTREKLAVSEALARAQKDHERATAIAESHRARLATTAHDIKQPLVSLRMAMMRLKEDDAQAAAQISGSFDYLDELVRTNLEDTKPKAPAASKAKSIETFERDSHETVEERQGELEEFPVMVILTNVVAMFRDEARDKGLELKLVPSSAIVEFQPVALMRIVSNLVSNAIKYTHEGSVLIGCRRKGGAIRIEIHDTGPGLSAQEIGRVMKPYERGGTPGGTGLGLAVVTELARHYGMSFSLASRPGHGTVSQLTIPAN